MFWEMFTVKKKKKNVNETLQEYFKFKEMLMPQKKGFLGWSSVSFSDVQTFDI